MADDSSRNRLSQEPPSDAVAYDTWFREQVELGIEEADRPDSVAYSQQEVFRELDVLRAEWRRRAEKQREVA